MQAKFEIGTQLQSASDSRIKGTVTVATRWDSENGNQGWVYEFKNGNGKTFFGYKEEDLTAAN